MTNQINLVAVHSVYSGVNGKCCCGCAGKHSYASAHRNAASGSRGYPIEDNEVSDRSVAIIVGKLNRLPAWHPPLDLDRAVGYRRDDGGHTFGVIGQRLLVAYLD